MNTFADKLSTTEQAQAEPVVRQEPEPTSEAAVVELGKVSETRGGWIGPKLDTGVGVMPY